MKLRGESRDPVITDLKLKPGSTALTDLFTHLSHLAYSPYMVKILKSGNEALIRELLDTYELTDEIKDLIITYALSQDPATAAAALEPIKAAAADEIQHMWEELGIC
jgi:hypothetical protein